MKRTMAVFLCLILFGIFLQSEGQRPFTIDDYFKVKGISDIQISPDGTKIAFVKREVIPDEDKKGELKRKRDIYMGLKKLKNAETQLILYPREPHGIREIPHQSDRLQRIVSWFDRHMKK